MDEKADIEIDDLLAQRVVTLLEEVASLAESDTKEPVALSLDIFMASVRMPAGG